MNTIKIKYGLEDITSRVPGLFPYIEFDENHVSTVHPASDSDVGCYGKVACALTIPDGISFDIDAEEEDDEGQIITVTKHLIVPGMSYNYKTLMGIYYKYKDSYQTNSFILFIDKGIGKFKIEANIDFEYCNLVPEYEYYANCGRLWDEYTKIGIMCDKYQQFKEATGEINCDLECLLDKYSRMGGDVMRDYYGSFANVSDSIANEYYGYASDNFNLGFNINITASDNDLGIYSTYIVFFGEKYVNTLYAAEEILIPGTNPPIYKKLVVPIVRVVDPQDPSHPRSQDTMTNTEQYYLDDNCVVKAVRGVDYFLPNDFIIYNDKTYVCELPTINGEWSPNRFHLVNENYSDPTPDYNTYYNPNTGFAPSTTVNANSNSQLKGFIGEIKYLDESGNEQKPETDTDWLWYYRIGRVGFSETTTDKFNNIEILDGFNRMTNDDGEHYEMHLMAYGDIITDISRNQNDKTLTITYVIGAHLKAKLLLIDQDDDNNYHYYYGDYEYDPSDTHGVFYTEVYDYETDGEIDNMTDEVFEYFITHDKLEVDRNDTSTDPSIIVTSRYTKAKFNIYGHTNYADMAVNGDIISFPYIISNYTTSIQLNKDGIVNPLTRFDYLLSVPYKPTVKTDVHISRGNAAAWERHMKLGELKTFEDLESYSNGGFFNLR